MEVRIRSRGQSSDPVTVDLQALAPALFTRDGKSVASPGVEADGSVKPGATLALYGTGLGPLDPVRAAHQFEVLEDGDQRVIVRTGGVSSPEPADCCFVSVRR